MVGPDSIYEQLIEKRAPDLKDSAKKRAVKSLHEIDRLRGNLAKEVGPNIGLQLVLDLTSNRLSDLAILTFRSGEEQLVDAEYNRANLRTASEKILSKVFPESHYPYLVRVDEIDKQIDEWHAFESEYLPYAMKALLLREIIRKVQHPNQRFFYFHRLIPNIADEKAINLLTLFLNARGLYPIEAVSNTDYQAESEEIIETLKQVVVPANSQKITITGEEVMGLFLAGSLTLGRKYDLVDVTPLNVLNLTLRSYNALKRAGADTVEGLEYLLLPENNFALKHIRNLGVKNLAEINERLTSYREGN